MINRMNEIYTKNSYYHVFKKIDRKCLLIGENDIYFNQILCNITNESIRLR